MHPGNGSKEAADSTVFAIPASAAARGEPARLFKEYQSGTGWSFTAVKPAWIELPPERTDKGYPVRTLVRQEDRKLRISIFETVMPKDRPTDRQTTAALAYLFKSDPDSAWEKAEPPRPYLFKSPRDTLKHWGLLMRMDSVLLYVSV